MQWKFTVLGGLCVLGLLAPGLVAAEEKKEYPTQPQVSGFFLLDSYSGDSGDVDTVENTFLLRRARLGVKGDFSEMISYQFVGGFDGADKTASKDASSAQLFDAWANMKLHPALQIRAGQFKYNFDLEGKMSAPDLPFATRASIVNNLIGKLGRNGSIFRDIGVEVHGGGKAPVGWGYTVGVVNGNGANIRDDNENKDVYVRGTVAPVGGVSLGAGFYSGDAMITTDPDPTVTGDEVTTEQNETVWTADVLHTMGPFAFMAAYYQATLEVDTGDDVEPVGWYAVGSYRLLSNLDLLLRYQQEDQDSNADEKLYSSLDIGLNYYFARKGTWNGTRLMLNYMVRDAEDAAKSKVWEERGADVTGEDVNNLFIARLQVPF
jgi:hypothetical protein